MSIVEGLTVSCMRMKWWYGIMALSMLALSRREAAPTCLLAAVELELMFYTCW